MSDSNRGSRESSDGRVVSKWRKYFHRESSDTTGLSLEQDVDLLLDPLAIVGLVRGSVGLVNEAGDVIDFVNEIE